jgi:hypothetical protein
MKTYGRVAAEKYRKSLEHGNSIPFWKFSDYFRCHLTNFLFCPTEMDHKESKKSKHFPKRNTASMLQ